MNQQEKEIKWKLLRNNKNVKELEVLQQQVNEDNKYLIESK